MLSCTLKDYNDNYQNRLDAYLAEYEDNSKTFFLQNEKKKYQKYHNALTKIANQMMFFTSEEQNNNRVHKSIADDLKNIYPQAYKLIITELLQITKNESLSITTLKKDKILINEIELENHIKSSIRILKFINDEYAISINSNSSGHLFYQNRTMPTFSSPKEDHKKTKLPVINNVFFVHYQCDDFNVSDEIKSLSIFADDKVIEFKSKSEAENIEEYCSTINNLLNKGLIPIHWSQNRPYFGVDHITSRYYKLTGKQIELEYKNSLNLSGILKDKFGEEYVNHPRLDNIAFLNSFNGISTKEKGQRTFDANRVLLLSKIYFGILNKSLKIGVYNNDATNEVTEQSTNDIEVIEQSSLNDFTSSTNVEYLEDKKNKVANGSSNTLTTVDKNIFTSETFNENLKNDPLHNSENEYQILKSQFKEDYASRTAHLKTDDDFLYHYLDIDFDEWENAQNQEIKNSFLKLIKELNQNKIFFFGCSFDNYKHNYDKRLNEFLEYYIDASKYDFVEDELKFLTNILLDIQNPLAANDGCTRTGKDNFIKANEFVSITGYKQYFFSHNKKEAFLNEKQQELINKQQIINDVSTNNHPDELGDKKRKKFGIKKMIGTLNRSESEQKEIDEQVDKKEDVSQNNILKSTIEDYLEEFKPDINGDGYEILINALFEYFTNGEFPVLEGKIKFKKINKKRVGWALKELYKSEKTDNLEIEYFRFAQENINLFEKEVIVMENFNKSNFYKTFTSNPSK